MYHIIELTERKPEYSVLLLGLDNAGKTTLLSQIKAHYQPRPNGTPNPGPNPSKTVPTVGQNVANVSLPDMQLKIWDVGGQISMRGLWQSYYTSCHAIIFVVDSTDVGQNPDITRLPPVRRGSTMSGSTRKGSNGGVNTNSSAGTNTNKSRDRKKKDDDYNEDEDEDQDQDQDEEEDGANEEDITTSPNLNPFSAQMVGINASPSQFGRLDECRQVLESVLQHSDVAGVPILVLANKQDREDCVEVVRIKEGLVRKVFEGEKGGGVRDSRVMPVSALMGTGVQEAVEWVQSRVKWNKDGRPPVMK